MAYIDGESQDQSRALLFAALMVMFGMLARVFHTSCDGLQVKTTGKMRRSVKGLIYSKIFTLSSATNKKFKKGDINNLVESETGKICRFFWELPHIAGLPMVITTCCYTLYTLIGHIVWFAVLIIAITLFAVSCLVKFTSKLHEKKIKDEDSRSNCMSEIIDNIRVIKMNSWTSCFYQRINNLRSKEYMNMLYDRLLRVPHHLLWVLSHWVLVLGIFLLSLTNEK